MVDSDDFVKIPVIKSIHDSNTKESKYYPAVESSPEHYMKVKRYEVVEVYDDDIISKEKTTEKSQNVDAEREIPFMYSYLSESRQRVWKKEEACVKIDFESISDCHL